MIKVRDAVRGTAEVTKVFPGDVIAEEYESHFNRLTPGEAERLAVLIEEAAKVQAVACKILRHGYSSYNPDMLVKMTNRLLLEKEIGHLHSSLKRMRSAGDIVAERIHYHTVRKDDNGGQYMHHQPDTPEPTDV